MNGLRQRKPMARGQGFRRREQATRTPAEIEAACGFADDSGTFGHQQQAATKPLRRGSYAAPPPAAPVPKHPRAENPHLLRMAKGKPCLIRSPLCNFDPETTVACHGGGVANGKGMAYKVSDALTCWGCSACNHYTDAYGGATKAQKAAAFMLGHLAQVCEWRAIAGSTQADPKDRAAAQWALDQLNATPVGQGETL
ncbi:nuclease domain-containing protein [Variovorax sp. Varisp41]|uniref:nuclease domain-containing protein n=1 Tax=Variovorax sp. Varisp41 TaxID=3243033 RepID=UPI0039B6971D